MSNRNTKCLPIDPALIRLIIVDSFCGCGGYTTGAENATDSNSNRIAVVVAGINHDALAIASHAKNHPETVHFVEDVRDESLPLRILSIVQNARKLYPNAKLLFHASLECTNFSNAKGGKPRDGDSRSLADCMPMYLRTLQPDLFSIENVREFMAWGPLDATGKPESRTAGRDYQRWIRQICELGYQHDFRLLNSADFGAYTSRLRYFGLFTRPGVAAQWPAPTHAKMVKPGMFGGLVKWKAVADVLDFTDRGESIFGRKKPLVEKSLERIYAGLVKHVAGGDESFLVSCGFLHNPGWFGHSGGIDNPAPTIVARQDKAPVSVVLTESGETAIVAFDTDSPATAKIKQFMAAYGIVITMRMLRVKELKRIQGFPASYHLAGNETQQKKFIGNAIEGTIARKLVEAIN